MLARVAVFLGICFSVLLAQIIFVQWLTIEDIRPDFILVLVLIAGRVKGRLFGQMVGFFMGLIIDAIGVGSYLGLSAFAKTVAWFAAGYLKGRKWRLNFYVHALFNFLVIVLHFSIFYFINFAGSELSIEYIFVRYILPSSFYTLVIFLIVDRLLSLEE